MAEDTRIVISAIDKTSKGFKSATSGLKKVAGAVLSAKTAIVGLVGTAGIGALITASLRATDTLTKTASKIGTTTESLSALRYAADISGVATNTLDMALQRFTRRSAEAAAGTGEAKAAIKELGLNARELQKLPLDKQMLKLADAFGNVETESDKLRLAFKLFDSEGAALVNTLSLGSKGMQELFTEAEDLGLIMSTTASKGVENTVDSLTRLFGLMRGITNQTVAALAPAIQYLTDTLRNFVLQGIKDADGSVTGFAQTLAINLISGIQTALKAFEDLANGFLAIYNTALKVKDGLTRAFTPDIEKNARQLQTEIDKLNEKLAGGKMRQKVRQNTKERLASLIALKEKAVEAGDSLGLIDKLDFASGMIKHLENAKKAIGEIPTITESITPRVLASMNNIDLAFKDWSDGLPTMEENLKSLTDQGLNGLTDALTAGVTGAANFADAMKSMAKSVVDSLIKMLIQKYIVDAAFGAITAGFGGGGSPVAGGTPSVPVMSSAGSRPMSPRAIGGSVQAGQPYMVGERGQEMFVPNQSGSIIPNEKMGGGGVVVNQTINVTTGVQQTVRAEIATLMPQIANAAKGAVVEARQRGGGYSKALLGA
jgi:hypothetical protein